MTLRASSSRALKDALARSGPEPFEEALGRSVRRHGGDYAEYVELISRVRETARKRKVSLRAAAQHLVDHP